MTSRLATVILPALMLLAPPVVLGQVQTEVTVTIPLRLTRIGPDVSKVAVWCQLGSSAMPLGPSDRVPSKQVEFPISGGELTTDATLVFSLAGLVDPVGKSAVLDCQLTGLSVSTSQWLQFSATATNLSFRSTDPTTTGIRHTFTW